VWHWLRLGKAHTGRHRGIASGNVIGVAFSSDAKLVVECVEQVSTQNMWLLSRALLLVLALWYYLATDQVVQAQDF
jgi:hypothetical protein